MANSTLNPASLLWRSSTSNPVLGSRSSRVSFVATAAADLGLLIEKRHFSEVIAGPEHREGLAG